MKRWAGTSTYQQLFFFTFSMHLHFFLKTCCRYISQQQKQLHMYFSTYFSVADKKSQQKHPQPKNLSIFHTFSRLLNIHRGAHFSRFAACREASECGAAGEYGGPLVTWPWFSEREIWGENRRKKRWDPLINLEKSMEHDHFEWDFSYYK